MSLQLDVESQVSLPARAAAGVRRAAYRPEIDGLRAVAVVCVVLFHAGLPLLAGGFLGVDVFFVISGFLITGRLIADLDAGRFSLARFYDHRVRRILPAAIAVIAITTVLAMLVLAPGHLRAYARSLVANSLFLSNVEFWHESGYFDSSAALKPLLHTWSLSLEEQFYLVVPLGLFAVHRIGLPFPAVLALGFVASFAAALHLAAIDPSAAFYLLTARSWELLAGSLAACAARSLPALPSPLPRLLALAGLCLVVASAVAGTPAADDAVWLALAAVSGAALVLLFSEGDALLARLLATPPMRWLGLVSYALYLWHQPMLVLPRHVFVGAVPVPVTLALVAASVLLAWATTVTVERYFRYAAPPRVLYGFVIGGTLALLATGAVLVARDGELAFNGGFEQAPARTELIRQNGRNCQSRLVDRCVFTVPGATRMVYLVGDSHAGVLLPPLLARQRAGRFDITDYTVAGCPLSSTYSRRHWSVCSPQHQKERMDALLAATPGIVVLGAWLPGYLYNSRDYAEADNHCGEDVLIESARFPCGTPGRIADIERSFVADIGALVAHGDKVVIVEPAPTLRYDANDFEAKRRFILFGRAADAITLADYRARSAASLRIYRAAKAAFGASVVLVPVGDVLCPGGTCSSRVDGHLAYYDTSHYSPFGAELVTAFVLKLARPLFR